MNALGTCKFCNKQYEIQMYSYNCSDCNVRYLAVPGNEPFYIAFYFKDPQVHSLTTNLSTHEKVTTIWLEPADLHMKHIKVNQVWPNLNPQEALQLAQRIYKLKAFL